MTNTFDLYYKCKVYNDCIILVITYRCETWRWTKSQEKGSQSHTETNGKCNVRNNSKRWKRDEHESAESSYQNKKWK